LTAPADAADLDVFAAETVDDPYPLYARLREAAPVHNVPGTAFYLVSSWDLVTEASGRTGDFSSNLRGILVQDADGKPERFGMDMDGTVEQVLATADGADHKLHRKLVIQALARRIRALETTMDDLVRQCWDEHARDGRVDWTGAVADRLPPTVLARLLGIPDEDIPRLLKSAYESVELLGGLVPPERLDYLLGSTLELAGYLEAQLAAATGNPGDGLLGVLGTAVADGEVESGTAVMMLMQLVGAGAETTAGLIGTAARQLAQRPGLQDQLRADPALIDPFLDECLRVEPPLRGHYRVITRDTELGGVRLPAGGHLLLLWSAANRDPGRYERPDEIDLTRSGIRQHLAFGKGLHFCVGSPLARLEATAAVRVLLERTRTFALDPAVPPRWVRSVVVRRHAALSLTYEPA
jgi:cytochrome P450